MSLFSLEHGKAAYRADFMLYGAAVAGLGTFLLIAGPRNHRLAIPLVALAGLLSWSLIEYLMHRLVLHGLPPFCHWHEQHHQRPMALLGAPTLLSGGLIAALVFVPAWLSSDLWYACALTFGVSAGYLAFSITHHGMHHWRGESSWMKRRKRWHALHHHAAGQPGCYGVTSSLWDHVFATTVQSRGWKFLVRVHPMIRGSSVPALRIRVLPLTHLVGALANGPQPSRAGGPRPLRWATACR